MNKEIGKRLKEALPNALRKENNEDWYKSMLPDLDLLIQSEKYEHALTENILSNLVMYCLVEGVFKWNVNQDLSKVHKKVWKMSFMTQHDKDKRMERESLGTKTLLTSYVDLYTMEEKENK